MQFRRKVAVSLALVGLSFVSSLGHAENRSSWEDVIYGDDGRRDPSGVVDPELLRLADSTVSLFETRKVERIPGGDLVKLSVVPFGSDEPICKDEPFFGQPRGAFCSGALIAPDLILTAGHCVRDIYDCDKTSFVFGFAVNAQGRFSGYLPASEVYQCKDVVASRVDMSGADFAILRLDRKVRGHQPLRLNLGGQISKDTRIAMVGHPHGLPQKIAEGSVVRDPKNGIFWGWFFKRKFFVTNLDSYAGNSGSPVFNAETYQIEGVLVRGQQDFERRPGAACYQSYRCSNDGCMGEQVTKISSVFKYLPSEFERRFR